MDLLDTDLRQKWYEMQPPAPVDRVEPRDCDPFDGESVPVPSNWAMLKEKWYFFEGSAWYTKNWNWLMFCVNNTRTLDRVPKMHSRSGFFTMH